MGLCDLWSVAEPSQKKKSEKEREVWSGGKSINQYVRQEINEKSTGGSMDGCVDNPSDGRLALYKCTSEGNTPNHIS